MAQGVPLTVYPFPAGNGLFAVPAWLVLYTLLEENSTVLEEKKRRGGVEVAFVQSSGLSHRMCPPGLPGRRSRAAQALVAPAGAKLPRTLSASAEPIPRSRPPDRQAAVLYSGVVVRMGAIAVM